MCSELQSAALPLLRRAPNGAHSVGLHRDCWVLACDPFDDLTGRMWRQSIMTRTCFRYTFLGKLLGVSVRTRHCLPLCFPPAFWKSLVGDCAWTLDDLASFDAAAAQARCVPRARLRVRVRACMTAPSRTTGTSARARLVRARRRGGGELRGRVWILVRDRSLRRPRGPRQCDAVFTVPRS